MKLLFIGLIVAVAIVVLAALAKTKGGRLGANLYRREEKLFSAAELRFLAALDQAIAPGQRVFGKVRVADLVAIKPGLDPRTRQAAVNRVAHKHFDFLVCTGPSLTPLCAVELNDSSHNSETARRRDELLSSICAQVGLPLLVVKAAGSYDPAAIRQQLSSIGQPSA